MNDTILYSIEAAVIFSILYLAYTLLIKHQQRSSVKRFSLIIILISAVSFPLIEIEVDSTEIGQKPSFTRLVSSIVEVDSPESAIPEEEKLPKHNSREEGQQTHVVTRIYQFGVVLFIGLLMFEMIKIAYWVFAGIRRYDLDKNVIAHKTIKSPFSFYKWIFIPANTNYQAKDWGIIKTHELCHLQQVHTFDQLLIHVFQVLCWWNPLVFIARKELNMIHEELADESVLKTTERESYVETLLRICLQVSDLRLGHSFPVKSTLTKRISLMSSLKPEGKIWQTGSLAFLSLILICLYQTSVKAQTISINSDKPLTNQKIFNGEFDTDKVLDKYGVYPDTWLTVKGKEKYYSITPVILTEDQMNLIEAYVNNDRQSRKKKGLNEREYIAYLGLAGEESIFTKYSLENIYSTRNKELSIELSTSELIDIYEASKDWADEYVLPIRNNYEFPEEIDFIKYTQLTIYSREPIGGGTKVDIRSVFDQEQVDIEPEPIGGWEKFEANCFRNDELNALIDSKNFPDDLEFEFVINTGGTMYSLNLITDLKGNKKFKDQTYKLIGDMMKNMLNASSTYKWTPGRKDETVVNTKINYSIGKEKLENLNLNQD